MLTYMGVLETNLHLSTRGFWSLLLLLVLQQIMVTQSGGTQICLYAAVVFRMDCYLCEYSAMMFSELLRIVSMKK